MKKQKIFFYSILLMGLAVLNACFDDAGTKILLNDASKSVVEIEEATTATGLDVSKSYLRLNDGKVKKDSIRINLVGPQRGTAVVVNFVVDPTSTAVAGFHYTLLTTGGSVTIAPNTSYAYIKYNVIADNINTGEVWKLKINLTTSDVKISPNYGVFTRSLRIACPFNRTNFLGPYSTLEPGYGTYDNTTSAATEANGVVITNFWDSGGTVKYLFNTDSATPTVTLPSQDVLMGGTLFVVAGTGVLGNYEACIYKFTVPYTVRRKSDNALFDNNTHTYTHK